MKKHLVLLLMTLLSLKAFAQSEPYAVLSEGNTVLTFYYDDQKASRNGMDVGPFSWDALPGWYDPNYSSIKKVVFDGSFADCISITSTAYWFFRCSQLETIIGISNLHTDNVTDMGSMFYGCSGLTRLDLSNLNTENVTSMASMFASCGGLVTLDLSCFNTEKATVMAYMFSGCRCLRIIDLCSFQTENVTLMFNMFEGCSNLKTIYADEAKWNTTNVTNGDDMFKNCTSLVGGNGTVFDENHTNDEYARIDKLGQPGYFKQRNENERVPYAVLSDDDTVLTFYYDTHIKSRKGIEISPFAYDFYNTVNSGWFVQRESITTVVFDDSFADCNSIISTAYWFYGCSSLTQIIGIEDLNTSNVTDMSHMFDGCSNLTSLNVSGFNTSNVTDMSCMFWHCEKMTSLDVSGWNTSKVTNMWNMFCWCSGLTSLDVSGFDTSNVTTMSAMFMGCSALTSLYLHGFNTSNVMYMQSMFAYCPSLTSLDLSGFDTSNVTLMRNMFYNCYGLTSLDVSGFNTSNVTDMGEMFCNCTSMTTIYADEAKWSTASVTNSACMFSNCTSLVGGNGTVYDASHTDAEYARIDKPGQPGYLTQKGGGEPEPYAVLSSDGQTVTFYYDDQKASRGGIDINNVWTNNSPYGTATTAVFDASFADYRPESTAYWFSKCSSLTTINGIENLKTDNVTDMQSMFWGCTSLTNLDVSGFNTSKVTDMGGLFGNCLKLNSLNLSNFDTSNVTNMNCLFYGCDNLTSLYFSSLFDTSNVTDMGSMFYGCQRLTSLNLSNFDTSNVWQMGWMFYGCRGLNSLDISKFYTDNVISMNMMFFMCNNLETIYVDEAKWSTANVTYGDNMFYDCTSLVGGNGTVYDPNHTDAEYARIDKPGQPGYFTQKEPELEPIDNADFSSDIDKETDLDGNVVGDIYYNISSGDGSYDPSEGCIVVTTPTDDSVIDGQDIFGEDFQAGFTGIVFMVPEGKGTIKVEAETTGTMVLKVKIGNNDPIEMELEGRLKVSFPYNVSEPTYVYIYGGSASAAPDMAGNAVATGELRLYGVEVVKGETGVTSIEHSPLNIDHYYTLDGRMLQGKPTQKGVYIHNGIKVVIK